MIDIGLYTPNKEGIGTQSFVSTVSAGREVTGEELLAQRFLMKFLKSPTSSPYFNDGCGFLDILQSNVITEFDIFSAFATSLSEIRSLLRAEEDEDTPDNETFMDASIIELSLYADKLLLGIGILSKAGTVVGVRLPVEVS